jgi:hypothetical protein
VRKPLAKTAMADGQIHQRAGDCPAYRKPLVWIVIGNNPYYCRLRFMARIPIRIETTARSVSNHGRYSSRRSARVGTGAISGPNPATRSGCGAAGGSSDNIICSLEAGVAANLPAGVSVADMSVATAGSAVETGPGAPIAAGGLVGRAASAGAAGAASINMTGASAAGMALMPRAKPANNPREINSANASAANAEPSAKGQAGSRGAAGRRPAISGVRISDLGGWSMGRLRRASRTWRRSSKARRNPAS